jgi:hypothetical protein
MGWLEIDCRANDNLFCAGRLVIQNSNVEAWIALLNLHPYSFNEDLLICCDAEHELREITRAQTLSAGPRRNFKGGRELAMCFPALSSV